MRSLRMFMSIILILSGSVGGLLSFVTLFPQECHYSERSLQEFCSARFDGTYFWEGVGLLAAAVVLVILAGKLWPPEPGIVEDDQIQAE